MTARKILRRRMHWYSARSQFLKNKYGICLQIGDRCPVSIVLCPKQQEVTDRASIFPLNLIY
jgi:hypothetical protein